VEKRFFVGQKLDKTLRDFGGLIFQKNFFDFLVSSVEVFRQKVSENGPNFVVFLILRINTVYKFFSSPPFKIRLSNVQSKGHSYQRKIFTLKIWGV